jgi:hypothetical protein
MNDSLVDRALNLIREARPGRGKGPSPSDDRKAGQPLQFDPEISQVQSSIPRLSGSPESGTPEQAASPAIEPGSIVLVESKDKHIFAVVDLVSLEEPGSNLRPGLWLCLLPADGEWFWCHESRILDRQPACWNCGTRGRWQRIGQRFACTACKTEAQS